MIVFMVVTFLFDTHCKVEFRSDRMNSKIAVRCLWKARCVIYQKERQRGLFLLNSARSCWLCTSLWSFIEMLLVKVVEKYLLVTRKYMSVATNRCSQSDFYQRMDLP
jgi:hypothetical protein